MTPITALPQDLQIALGGRDLIVFDGVCVLCSGFFRFVLSHDKPHRFSFALAQSPLGSKLYDALGLPTQEFDSNLVIVNGQIHQRGDAFAHAMRALGWPWKTFYPLRFIPAFIKDPTYYLIARNRYRLFGHHDTCLMPDTAVKSRFLSEGWVGVIG